MDTPSHSIYLEFLFVCFKKSVAIVLIKRSLSRKSIFTGKSMLDLLVYILALKLLICKRTSKHTYLAVFLIGCDSYLLFIWRTIERNHVP